MGIEPTSEAWEGSDPTPFSIRGLLAFRRKAHLLVHSSEYGLRIAWLDSSCSSASAFALRVRGILPDLIV
jgi:hypothetical protein